ncbi:hypothetical protein HHX48_09635 [Salinimonas sp. HHU 13199]|uniref:Periplasmic lipoprotein (DUF2279) n=1 Tax=Salinimonas profundi TaxID=2729140 RepID=A0ABR8LJQ9_9ALTE|nr:hypothetical protein [Salinimonas profundi]MBD3585997.1 hypothetical protein [Salinimonas profundi]
MSVIRFLGALITGLLAAIVLLIVLILDTSPSVSANASEQIADADTVKKLLAQIRRSINDRERGHVITISEQQVESLIGFVQRAAPYIHGTSAIHPDHGTIEASVAVPAAVTTLYLNLEIKVLPADRLAIDHVRMGSLSLPGPFAVGLVESALNIYTDSEIGTQAKEQITRVAMTETQVAVTLQPMDSFLRQLNEIRAGFDEEERDELTKLTAYYLRYIAGREIALKKKPQPFNAYLNLIMARAREQSTQDNVLQHNKAAVLALAIFIGHHRIANFVGDVQPDVEHALKPASSVLLRGRSDLSKHFIISAALKMLSEQDVTVAIGEFKELMDRGMGGSGYSFVDLAADLAGVELARVLADPDTALRAQNTLASTPDESVYMPEVDGLIEGLSKQEFTRRYEKVDSEAYLQEVEQIRAKLAQMPFYNRESAG